jgi:hypothetical protein
MSRLANRKGFALPMSILVIAVLTAALAAAYSSTNAEFTTNAAQRSENRAYNLAETGLEQFLVLRNSPGFCDHCGDPLAVDSEWTRVNLPGGYADVVAVKVKPGVDPNIPAIYFIRSKGVDTTIKLSSAMAVNAEHTVAIYAKWITMNMKVSAAWVSLSGLQKNGTGTIDGRDACGKMPDVAGAQTINGDFQNSGLASAFYGNPPVDTMKTFPQLVDQNTVDWNGIINQNSMAPDITVPDQPFPSADVFAADTNYWPVIRVKTNNYRLPNAGRGIIIADSNFEVHGSNMWSGILLVGGALTSDGNNTTWGATLSGLNYLLGGTPSISVSGNPSLDPDDAMANGQKTYVYDSCSVSLAAQRMRKYISIPNSWMDNLASW